MSMRSVVFAVCLAFCAMGGMDGPRRAAAAELIIKRPFTGPRRDIEINVHGTIAYGFCCGVGGAYYDAGFGYYGGYYGYYGGYAVGPGVQMLFPVVKNGFIPQLNNAFYVGFTSDFLYVPYFDTGGFFSFTIGPIVQWRFYILDVLSVFNNIGFEFWPFFGGGRFGLGTTYSFAPIFELGVNWHFAKHIALTGSFGYPDFKVGVSFGF